MADRQSFDGASTLQTHNFLTQLGIGVVRGSEDFPTIPLQCLEENSDGWREIITKWAEGNSKGICDLSKTLHSGVTKIDVWLCGQRKLAQCISEKPTILTR